MLGDIGDSGDGGVADHLVIPGAAYVDHTEEEGQEGDDGGSSDHLVGGVGGDQAGVAQEQELEDEAGVATACNSSPGQPREAANTY